MEEKINIITEVIELCSEVSKNLAQSEDMVNNGEVKESMVVLKRGSTLLQTCKKDCFKELQQAYMLNQVDCNEDATVLNLVVCLSDLINACTMLLRCEMGIDADMKNIAINKISTSLCNVIDISDTLFD